MGICRAINAYVLTYSYAIPTPTRHGTLLLFLTTPTKFHNKNCLREQNAVAFTLPPVGLDTLLRGKDTGV